MAMNISGLAGEIKTEIETAYGKAADDPALLQKFCDAIAKAVVNHIMTNATITFASGDIPVQVSTTTGAGSNTGGGGTGKIS